MSVLVDQNTRVLIQGITGREGTFHARGCREYGTKIVAGVTPGRGGTVQEEVPVFDTVQQAVRRTGAEVSERTTLSSRASTPGRRRGRAGLVGRLPPGRTRGKGNRMGELSGATPKGKKNRY